MMTSRSHVQPYRDFPGMVQAKQDLTHSEFGHINVDEIINFIGYGPLQVLNKISVDRSQCV